MPNVSLADNLPRPDHFFAPRKDQHLQGSGGTESLHQRVFMVRGIAMSVLSTVLIGWLVLNGAVFAALLIRRPRPELRSRLFLWDL
jgi:hypothetical protein